MGWGNSPYGHKKTVKCPKCNYTSRQWVAAPTVQNQNKYSNSSQYCPKHRLKLEPPKEN